MKDRAASEQSSPGPSPRKNNLTGLEFAELVYDNGPVCPRYAPPASDAVDMFRPRAQLEADLLGWRCNAMSLTPQEIDPAIRRLITDGYIKLEDRLGESGD